jgi:ADP-ribose pyrophosphatase
MSKIPPHADRVFKGVIFDIHQWQQEMYDGSTAVFEIASRAPTVEVIALDGEDIIFSQQEQPNKGMYYSFLGGRGEPGEDPLHTAQRELMEESGLASDNWRLLRTYPFPGKIDWTVYLYLATDCRTVAAPALDAGECITLIRMPFRQFMRDIVPQPMFYCSEFRAEVMSAYNHDHAALICRDVLGDDE